MANPAPTIRLHGLRPHPGAPAPVLTVNADDPLYRGRLLETERHIARAAEVPVTGCGTPPRWRRSFVLSYLLGGRWTAVGGPRTYQTLSPAKRLKMTIGSERVAEIDMNASHLTFLHRLFRRPRPEGDLYALPGVRRLDVKAWVTASLSNGRPLMNWPEAHRKAHPHLTRRDCDKVAEAVLSAYPLMLDPWRGALAVSHLGDPARLLGPLLTGLEAQAITDAMRDIWKAGEAQGKRWLALPLGDGLLVPESAVEAATEALKVAAAVPGVVLRVTRAGGGCGGSAIIVQEEVRVCIKHDGT